MNGALVELARAHAPLLAVGAPFLGAAIAALIAHARLSWLAALLAAAAVFVIALDIVARHALAGAPIVHVEEGVALSLEGVGVFGAALLSGLLLLALMAAGAHVDEIGRRISAWAWALALCVGGGWMGALLSGDLIGVLVAAEIAWIASIALFALSRERGALSGAFRMFAAGGFAAAFGFLGLAMIARAMGGVSVAIIAEGMAGAPQLATFGVALVAISLAMKACVAPLNFWAGAAFGRAGAGALFVVGVAGVSGALLALARVASLIAIEPDIGEGVSSLLGVLGFMSAVIGSVQAVGAVNINRLAAAACASQGGCILLSLALGSPAGLAAALVQSFALGAGLMALLGGAAVARAPTLAALDGLARRAPIAALALTAGALSFMGAPLTIGFLGRWRLIEASIGAGWWWAAGAALACSLAAVIYGGRLVERVFFRRATTSVEIDTNPWRFAIAPVLLAAIAAIALGFEPSLLLDAASDAAAMQLGRAP